jgi:environmental stress-induced protein Ves
MMPIVLHKTDYVTTQWTGGSTTQMLILPRRANYAKRNFEIRISAASIEIPESNFTSLPGVLRSLVLLKGALLLSSKGKGNQLLLPGDVTNFNGKETIHCKGTGSDYNVMLKGDGEISSQYLWLHKGEEVEVDFEPQMHLAFLHVAQGKISIKWLGLNQKMDEAMSCYVAKLTDTCKLYIKANTEAKLVLSEVWKYKK